MLSEHNIPVYQSLEDTMTTDKLAVVVVGTGIGKTQICCEYLEKHSFKALVVIPRHVVGDSWRKYANKNIELITYQKISKIYKDLDYKKYDLVICDEVHHVGAPTWSKGVKWLIKHNVRIIGLTDDPVRYTDGARDVCEEMFNGNACVGESVVSAIQKKILNPVLYVGAFYDTNGLRELPGVKKVKELYAKLDLALNNTPTVHQIIQEEMPKDSKRKGIIFVSTINEIKEGVQLIKDAIPNAKIKVVHSKQSDVVNQQNLDWFKRCKEGYLCAVDMLSEGVHVKGVNTLFMLRKTKSPNVFRQQLGRCLDINSKEQGVVFDLVNNQYNVNISFNKMQKASNIIEELKGIKTQASSMQFIIHDRTDTLVNIMNEIGRRLGRHDWTPEEEAILKENYWSKGFNGVKKMLPSTISSTAIRSRIAYLGLRADTHQWTDSELEILRKYYLTEGKRVSARLKGRTPETCKVKAREIGLHCNYNPLWTKEEIEILKEHYPSGGWKEVNKLLPTRTKSSIKGCAQKIGIKSEKVFNDWSNNEIQIIKKYYPKEGRNCISRLPGRTIEGLVYKAKNLKIRKETKTC